MVRGSSPPKQLMNLSNRGAGKPISRPIETVEAISFNLNSLVAPQRTYSAELCSLQYTNGELYFIFAQRKLMGGDALDSAISLRMHGFYAKQFLKSMEAIASPGLQELAEKLGISTDSVESIKQEPTHIAKMSANIVQAAIAGYDSCCDFYQFSPNLASRNKTKKEGVDLVPVARVELRTALLIGIYDELKRLEPNFPDGEGGGAMFAMEKVYG